MNENFSKITSPAKAHDIFDDCRLIGRGRGGLLAKSTLFEKVEKTTCIIHGSIELELRFLTRHAPIPNSNPKLLGSSLGTVLGLVCGFRVSKYSECGGLRSVF